MKEEHPEEKQEGQALEIPEVDAKKGEGPEALTEAAKIQDAPGLKPPPPSPPAEGGGPSTEHRRQVTQADLDRCYQNLEPILGMGEAANWDENDDDLGEPELVDREDPRPKKKTKRILGIDIGETSVKLVELGPKQTILTMDMAPLEAGLKAEEREDEIVQAIRTMMERNKTKTRKAVLCLSEKSTHMRTAPLNAQNKAELQKALVREAGKLELTGEQENYVFNHIVLENENAAADAPAMTGLFFSTEREAVIRTVRIAKAAKLNAVAIDIDALAAVRFYREAYRGSERGTTVLAEMHAANTLVSFVEGERLIWAKHLTMGSHEFTASIAKALRIDAEEAENLKRGEWKGATEYQDKKSDVIRAVEPVLNRLSGEIRRTVQFYLSQEKNRRIHRLVLAGTGSRIPGLAKDLTRLLDIPVVRWGETRRFDFTSVLDKEEALPDKLSRFAVSLGLCLWNKSDDPINLLPGPWERLHIRRRGEKARSRGRRFSPGGMPGLTFGRGLAVGGAAAVLFLGAIVLMYAKHQGMKTRLDKEQLLMQEWNPVRENLARRRALRERVAEKAALFGALRARQTRLAEGIAAFSAAVPPSVEPVSFGFEDRRFKLQAYTVSAAAVQSLIAELQRSDHFSEPALEVMRKTEDHPGKPIYFELYFGLRDAEH